MSYIEFKALPDFDKYTLREEHQRFCRNKQIHDSQNWRPMTEEERNRLDIILEKEKKRYEISLKNGGIDDRGNYTALHHR